MKITEDKIKFVMGKDIEAIGNNTVFIITWLETVCESRGIPKTWENIKALMKSDYPPESLVRARRKFVSGTKKQKEVENAYYNHYSD